MIDGVGNVSSVVVLGADNPLCLATVDRLVGPRLAQVFLVGSAPLALARGSQRIREFGIPNVTEVEYQSGDNAEQQDVIADLFASCDIDVVIIGPTPQATAGESQRPSSAATPDYLQRALLDTVFLAEQCADGIARQGHGVLCLFTHAPAKPTKASAELDSPYCATMAALHVLGSSIAQRTAAGGGRTVCGALDPIHDPNAWADPDAHSSTLSPLDVASSVAPFIVSRRQHRPYEVIALPKSIRRSASRIRPRR